MPRLHAALAALALFALGGVPARGAEPTLDKGRLETAWFGAGIEFREADEIDYLWIRPGFALDGRKLRFAPWAEPEFLGKEAAERDAGDRRLARLMTATMPEIFSDAFSKAFGERLTIVPEGEEVRAEGRIVDCSTGANAAKVLVGFGAGAGSTTIDLRLLDAASGELLVAIHHRAVSGTSWSTTDSKLVSWVEDLADEAAKQGFETLYREGKRVRK